MIQKWWCKQFLTTLWNERPFEHGSNDVNCLGEKNAPAFSDHFVWEVVYGCQDNANVQTGWSNVTLFKKSIQSAPIQCFCLLCTPPKRNTAQILIPELIQLKGFQLELKRPTNRLKSYREIVVFFSTCPSIEKLLKRRLMESCWFIIPINWWDPRSSPLPLPNRDLAPEPSHGVFSGGNGS